MSRLQIARVLADGRIAIEAPDLTHRLHYGDATLGWGGDERMLVFHNEHAHRREVWRDCEDGEIRLVMVQDGDRGDDAALIRAIVDHDTRHIDVAARVVAENERLRRERDAAFSDRVRGEGDRLAHALAKDLDMAAPDGKVYPLR